VAVMFVNESAENVQSL